jgi:hypothetical protein
MAETFTMNEASANAPEILNSDEQESLAIAESLEQGEQPLLAGKFKDPQALEQAYVELQKKLGEPRDEVQATEDEGESAEDEPEAEAETEDAGEEVLSEEQAEMLMEMVGGEKAYKSMLDWASEAFDAEEIEMYDSVMESGNPNAIYYAIQALKSRYSDAVGSDGQTLTGRAAVDTDDSFQSQAELVAAMSDPRYDRDPAYRSNVMRRLENSDVQF